MIIIDTKRLKNENWFDIFCEISQNDIVKPLNDILQLLVLVSLEENLDIIKEVKIYNELLFKRGTINDLLKNYKPIEIFAIVKNSNINIDDSSNYILSNGKISSVKEYKKDIMALINDIKYIMYKISNSKNIDMEELCEGINIVLNTNY